MAKELRQIRALKHHPIRGAYERLLDFSDHVLQTIDPQKARVTNTYAMVDVHLLDTPKGSLKVRLRVPSGNCCGQLEELTLSSIDPNEYAQLLKFMKDAVTSAKKEDIARSSIGERRSSVGARIAQIDEFNHFPAVELDAAEVAEAKADESVRQAAALRAAEAHAAELQAALDGATRREAAAAAREAAAVPRHAAATQAATREVGEMRVDADEGQQAMKAYEAELSRLELQAERAYASEVQAPPRLRPLTPNQPGPTLRAPARPYHEGSERSCPCSYHLSGAPYQAEAEIERLRARHDADQVELSAARRKLWVAQGGVSGRDSSEGGSPLAGEELRARALSEVASVPSGEFNRLPPEPLSRGGSVSSPADPSPAPSNGGPNSGVTPTRQLSFERASSRAAAAVDRTRKSNKPGVEATAAKAAADQDPWPVPTDGAPKRQSKQPSFERAKARAAAKAGSLAAGAGNLRAAAGAAATRATAKKTTNAVSSSS